MRRVLNIIESKKWVNSETGATASIYGSLPYWTEAEGKKWKIVTSGYTWQLNDGTIGLGRIPAKTYEEAVEVMNSINNRYN